MRLSRRRLFAAFAAIAAAGVAGLMARGASARYYHGPVSDHFDGTRFFDVNGAPPRSLSDVIRWRMSGAASNWPASSASPHSDRPPPRARGPVLAHFFRRTCNVLISDGRAQPADRSGLVGARVAAELRRPEACQRSRHRVRGLAADQRRPGLALPLRPPRLADLVPPYRRPRASSDSAARQRHDDGRS